MHRSTTRLQPLRALRAMGGILRDPEDITQISVTLEALGGRSLERMLERFLRRPGGEAILRRQLSLFDVLSDLDALRRLPEHSLGHGYARYIERERLDLAALRELGTKPAAQSDEQPSLAACLHHRAVALHDLLHVVTGYGRDLVGEASLNAFAWAQTGNPATAFLWAVTWLLTCVPIPGAARERWGLAIPAGLDAPGALAALRAEMWRGDRLGREADWLFGVDWEALLGEPIEAVRGRFGVRVACYEPVRSAGAPEAVAA